MDYERPPPTFGKVSKETHYLQAASIRIDQRIVSADPQLTFLRQLYTLPSQTFTFSTTRATDGRLVGASAMDDPLNALPAATLRQWSRRWETHLGERCRVWQASGPVEKSVPFIQSGCTTADGIELWRKRGDIDAIFATRVRRMAVSAEAVRLPFAALDTAALMRAGVGADHRHDYDAELRSPFGASALFRRSGNWVYVEERAPNAISISIHNSAIGADISYSHRRGTRRLSWSSRPLSNVPRSSGIAHLQRKGPAETVLGEECRMTGLMPRIADSGQIDCFTPDGIPLLSHRQSGTSMQILTAVRLSRKPQPLSKVMLPDTLSQPATWASR